MSSFYPQDQYGRYWNSLSPPGFDRDQPERSLGTPSVEWDLTVPIVEIHGTDVPGYSLHFVDLTTRPSEERKTALVESGRHLSCLPDTAAHLRFWDETQGRSRTWAEDYALAQLQNPRWDTPAIPSDFTHIPGSTRCSFRSASKPLHPSNYDADTDRQSDAITLTFTLWHDPQGLQSQQHFQIQPPRVARDDRDSNSQMIPGISLRPPTFPRVDE